MITHNKKAVDQKQTEEKKVLSLSAVPTWSDFISFFKTQFEVLKG